MQSSVFMRALFTVLLVLLVSLYGIAQTPLKLIPMPQEVLVNQGRFLFTSEISICTQLSDTFLLNELRSSTKKYIGLDLKEPLKPKSGYIELIKCKTSKEYAALFSKSHHAEFSSNQESYKIEVKPNYIKAYAISDEGLFYAVQTLKQLISANAKNKTIPCIDIFDAPDFAVRAWQDDISRGPMPSVEYLKEEIRKMASFKLNYLTLYTEHVFKLNKYPDISPNEGITKEDLNEVIAFANRYHVKVIGNYQSFGHMEKTLSLPSYKHLVENGHILSPVLKESYEFLSDVYAEIASSYTDKYFNINCDETFGLGEEKSKALVDSIGLASVYAGHIAKVDSLLKSYHKQILMWGDIATNHPDIIPKLPKDITVMAWAYHGADSFDQIITPISKAGLNFWVAPGVNCWSNIYPNLAEAEVNIFNFIRDAYKFKASGVLNTSWDDDGLNFFENNYQAFAWGAALSWNTPKIQWAGASSGQERIDRYKEFNASFNTIYFSLDNYPLTDMMHCFSLLHSAGIREALKNTTFFQSVFPIHFDNVQEGRMELNQLLLFKNDSMQKELISIKPLLKENAISLEYLDFAMKQASFLLKKNVLQIELYKFLEGDTSVKESNLKFSISQLKNEVYELKQEYVRLWKFESRNWWLDRNEKKFDDLAKSLDGIHNYCIISASKKLTKKGREIKIKTIFDDKPTKYELVDNTLTNHSKTYTGPLYFKKDIKISAGLEIKDIIFQLACDSFVYHKAIGNLTALHSKYSKYHPSYDGGGELALLDGRLGDEHHLRSGRWQGYSGQNIELEIDMNKREKIDSFSMGFYQNTLSWVVFPKRVEIYVKNHLKDEYTLVRSIESQIKPEVKGDLKQNYQTTFKDFKARYVKVIAVSSGKLPSWHPAGSTYDAMLFADEIIIK
jgi:hexosaminidase